MTAKLQQYVKIIVTILENYLGEKIFVKYTQKPFLSEKV